MPPADWPKIVTFCGTATEGCDLVADPTEGGDLVEQAPVADGASSIGVGQARVGEKPENTRAGS